MDREEFRTLAVEVKVLLPRPTEESDIEVRVLLLSRFRIIIDLKSELSSIFPEGTVIRSIGFRMGDNRTIFFDGSLEYRPDDQCEILIEAMADRDRMIYHDFLLDRYDQRYELSRKVEEIALEEIQQLNTELTLSLQVEEAALAEANQVNEELLLAQKELIKSRNQLKAIIDGIAEGIYLIDRDFQLLSMNRRQAEFVSPSLGSGIGHKCYMVFFKRDTPCSHCPAAVTLRTRVMERKSVILNNRDSNRYLEYSAFPIVDEQGSLVQVVLYVQDVTVKKEMEEHLFQTEKMASLGTMTAGIAHELRNPLSSISMTIQLIKKRRDFDEAILEKIDKIEDQVNKAGKIVTDIRNFSRKGRFLLTEIEISSFTHSVIDRLKEIETFLGFQLETNFAQTKLVMIEPDQLEQVIINLVMNALDAMEGMESPLLRISTGNHRDRHVFIAVEDTGEGISDERAKKIFDPFFTAKAPGRGTGLGLAICYKIIERHRGMIKVHSRPGSGSQFRILLPVLEKKS